MRSRIGALLLHFWLFGLVLISPSLVFAQFVERDGTSDAGCLSGLDCAASVDASGNIIIGAIIPGTGSANLGKAEDSVAGTGWTGVGALAVRNDAQSAVTTTDGDFSQLSVNNRGNAYVDINLNGQFSTAQGILKPEDTAHTSGDAGVAIFGVVNTSGAPTAANGDYAAIATDTAGKVYTAATFAEDTAIGGSENTNLISARREDALTQDTGASGDVSYVKVDAVGRLITTPAPAGETWSSCSASNTGTSDIEIKASVASNRIYVTSISCFNTASVASSISFKSNTTQIYAGGISNSTLSGVGVYTATLPIPLRTGVASAFNFAMGTTSTATTCCASGYISVN